ncbi:hypothetical protein [Streptomyces sp. MCC20]|uniref:hypothetical protein n=1 Tax=Streptomyces sediminimaris TaxID=3383721 RepID=UPI00399AC06D
MVGSRVLRRPAPSVLLIGLIVLVASHLVGALHGPGFVGPHKPVAVIAASSTAVAEPEIPGSRHGHSHDVFDDSLEHAVDRVRATADLPAHAPQPVEPVVAQRPGTRPSPRRAAPAGGVSAPAHGRSVCAQHCVWRQ